MRALGKGLDVVGALPVPVVEDVANGLGAAGHAYNGDYGSAATSLAALVAPPGANTLIKGTAVLGGGLAAAKATRAVAAFEKHHTLPLAFRKDFARIGIDIREVNKMTLRLPRGVHRALHKGGRGGAWNKEWSRFFAKGNATRQGAIQLRDQMISKYNLNQYKPFLSYKSGKPSGI